MLQKGNFSPSRFYATSLGDEAEYFVMKCLTTAHLFLVSCKPVGVWAHCVSCHRNEEKKSFKEPISQSQVIRGSHFELWENVIHIYRLTNNVDNNQMQGNLLLNCNICFILYTCSFLPNIKKTKSS